MSADWHAAPGRALVLGASGHIGQAIVRELLAQGWQVTAATRRHRLPEGCAEGCALAVGDADLPGQLDRWAAGHDAVFDAMPNAGS